MKKNNQRIYMELEGLDILEEMEDPELLLLELEECEELEEPLYLRLFTSSRADAASDLDMPLLRASATNFLSKARECKNIAMKKTMTLLMIKNVQASNMPNSWPNKPTGMQDTGSPNKSRNAFGVRILSVARSISRSLFDFFSAIFSSSVLRASASSSSSLGSFFSMIFSLNMRHPNSLILTHHNSFNHFFHKKTGV